MMIKLLLEVVKTVCSVLLWLPADGGGFGWPRTDGEREAANVVLRNSNDASEETASERARRLRADSDWLGGRTQTTSQGDGQTEANGAMIGRQMWTEWYFWAFQALWAPVGVGSVEQEPGNRVGSGWAQGRLTKSLSCLPAKQFA